MQPPIGMFAAALLSGSLWANSRLWWRMIGFYGMKTAFWPLLTS